MAAPKKEGGLDLAVIFGGAKGGGKPSPGASSKMDSDDMSGEPDEPEGSVPPDFEDHIVTAFPELEGSPDRQMAMWKAVKACMNAKGSEEY